MNYLNKYSGTAAAQLDYQGDGRWIVRPAEDNRYRVLWDDSGSLMENIYALDFEGMAGMIQVGENLPGYNREVKSINRIESGDFHPEYEIKCNKV